MSSTSVPETTSHFHSDSCSAEDDVNPSPKFWQWPGIETISQPKAVQFPTERNLRTGVDTGLRLHSASNVRRARKAPLSSAHSSAARVSHERFKWRQVMLPEQKDVLFILSFDEAA